MKVFARFSDAPTVGLINFKGGCHFLEDSNLCRIHHELGREAKPFVCKHFPFNRYLVSDDVLIVLPRLDLCPLQLCADASDGVVVRHVELLEELRADWDIPLGWFDVLASLQRLDESGLHDTQGYDLVITVTNTSAEEFLRDVIVEITAPTGEVVDREILELPDSWTDSRPSRRP